MINNFNIFHFFYQIFNYFGHIGPLIIIIFAIFTLFHKKKFLLFYILGIFFNIIFNFILKGIIKHSRPNIDSNIFKQAIKNNIRFIKLQNGFYMDIFGMPSGHSELVFFTTFYVYFVTKNLKILIPFIFISIITILQRYLENYHSILQIFFGSLFGVIFAIIFYLFAQKYIYGKLKYKTDDYAVN